MPDVPDSLPPPSEDAPAPFAPDVPPHGARRVRVRVGRDGTAMVGRKRVQFGRLLAGALVTVEA